MRLAVPSATFYAELEPGPLRRKPLLGALADRIRPRRFIDPAAAVVSINADGREVADPGQARRTAHGIGETGEHRVASFIRRDGDEQRVGIVKHGPDLGIDFVGREDVSGDALRPEHFGLIPRRDRAGDVRELIAVSPGKMRCTIADTEDK